MTRPGRRFAAALLAVALVLLGTNVAPAAAKGDDEAKSGSGLGGALVNAAKDSFNRTPGWFKKGELASVGALGFVWWENRVGAMAEIERLRELFYLTITPTINYNTLVRSREMAMSFGVPLRFQLLDTRGGNYDQRFGSLGRFRTEDWDSVEDYFKLIRYFTWGRKEDHIYVDVNGVRAATVGHGTIMKRYNPNLSIDYHRVSASFDTFSDYWGFELYANNFVPNLIGGLVFVKPLSFLDRRNYIMRSVSFGFTMLTDITAPVVNKLDVRDTDHDGRRGELLLGGTNQEPRSFSAPLLAWGFDAEVKFYKSPDKTVDLKAYVDLSFLTGQIPLPCNQWQSAGHRALCPSLFTNDPVTISQQPPDIETETTTSKGGALGVLGRFTLGQSRDHAVRVRGEARLYDRNYLPSYFDAFYQSQRLQYATTRDARAQNPANNTKLRRILEREGGAVFGFYAEGSYAYWERFEAALGIAINSATDDNALFLHLGMPRSEYFSFFLTYMKRSSAPQHLFDPSSNSLLIGTARAFILPVLHVHLEVLTPFGFGDDSQMEELFDINLGVDISFAY